MAERRMFSKSVTESDAFLDMPTSARCLYFHLGMQADDDGFISSPKAVVRSSNCSEDDLKLLAAKGFVVAFESGIIVIRHWKMHNHIQKDRYKPTIFKKEREQLTIENNVYQACIQSVSKMDTKCIQPVSKMDTQDSLGLGEESIYEISKDISCTEPYPTDSVPPIIELTLNDKSLYPITQTDIDEWGEIYPAVDILQQLRYMKGWLNSNPTKRKTKRGIKRFINSWLSKEQDKGGVVKYGRDSEKDAQADTSVQLYG